MIIIITMIITIITKAWRVLRLQMEEGTPDMEGSCEYFE
jgi:hypothetical protein